MSEDAAPAGGTGKTVGVKRVRFSASTETRSIALAEEDVGHAQQRQRQTILPGEDATKAQRTADKQPMPEPEGPIRALDPALAATRRAALRARAAAAAALMTRAEDSSLPDDLAAAEEDYEEPEELYNETGIPIEPFHLRAEREAGYFDAEGNYLEYRLEADDTDAWLESLMDDNRQIHADPALAARRRTAAAVAAAGVARGDGQMTSAAGGRKAGRGAAHSAAAGGAAAAATDMDVAGGGGDGDDVGEDDDDDDDDDGPYDMHMLDDTGADLREEERALYQKRIADLLLSGETPLAGLRRLGRIMHGAGAGGSARSTAGTAAVPAAVRTASPGKLYDAATATATATGEVVLAPVGALEPVGDAAGRGPTGGTAAAGQASGEQGGGQGGLGEGVLVAAAGGGDGVVTAIVGTGGNGVGGGGGGGGGLVHLSCGDRQRLRKMRRGHPAVPAVRQNPDPESGGVGGGGEGGDGGGLREQVVVAGEGDGVRSVRAQDVEMGEGGAVHGEEEVRAARGGREEEEEEAPPSPVARQSVAEAAAAAAARRHPAAPLSESALEARRQFDTLTSTANLLLSAGQYDVYGSTREQLLRAAQATLGVDVVRSLTTAGQRPVGQPVAPRGGAAVSTGGAAAAKRRRADSTAVAPSGEDVGQESTTAPVAAGSGRRVAAIDADVDMFGGDDETEREGSGTAGISAAESVLEMGAVTGKGSGGGSLGAGGASTLKTESGSTPPTPPPFPGGEVPMVGFVPDPATGYLYSSDLGYYYDPGSGLYGDASSGLWYRYVAEQGEGKGEGKGKGQGQGKEGAGGADAAVGRYVLVSAGEQQQQQMGGERVSEDMRGQ